MRLEFSWAEGGSGAGEKPLLRDTAAVGAAGLVTGNCWGVGESPEWLAGVLFNSPSLTHPELKSSCYLISLRGGQPREGKQSKYKLQPK